MMDKDRFKVCHFAFGIGLMTAFSAMLSPIVLGLGGRAGPIAGRLPVSRASVLGLDLNPHRHFHGLAGMAEFSSRYCLPDRDHNDAACDLGCRADRAPLTMKRDLSIFREILLQLEAIPAGGSTTAFTAIRDVDEATFTAHLALMVEAGFLQGEIIPDRNGGVRGVVVQKVTNKGYEFLDNIRDHTIWEKTKAKAGSASLEIMTEVAKALVKASVGLS